MDSTGSIDLRALRFFLSVYDAQNFSVVARREGVSASVVSRTILQLEDALGQQLFYRNTRAVIPTEAGRLFVDYARAIDSQFSDARQALQERSLQPSGLVRLNAPVFFGQRHIAPWLAGLSARYPLLEIELTLTDDYVDPHRTATDLIFRIGTLTDSSFHARVLGSQRYYLAAAPDYLARHGFIASPEALSEHHCLVYRGSAGANRWLFRRDDAPWVHYPVMPLLSSNNAETLLTAALGGMGMVLFPDWLTGAHLRTGKLVRLLEEYDAGINPVPQQIAAIYPNTRHPPLSVRVVIDYFVEVYGSPLYWQREASNDAQK